MANEDLETIQTKVFVFHLRYYPIIFLKENILHTTSKGGEKRTTFYTKNLRTILK
jgi:hypothetical protein